MGAFANWDTIFSLLKEIEPMSHKPLTLKITNPYLDSDPAFRVKRDSIDDQVAHLLTEEIRLPECQQMCSEVYRAINAWYYQE